MASRSSEAIMEQYGSSHHRKRQGYEAALNSNTGGGGVYLPPAKRRQLEKEEEDVDAAPTATTTITTVPNSNGNNKKSSSVVVVVAASIQRQKWQEQKRIVLGTINRLNTATIKPLIHDLFAKVNLIRLRGVLAKSLLLAAGTSPQYSNVYAALVAVINTKLPEVGELVVKRSILAFRRHYQRRDKTACVATTIFIAHLFHQAVVHELLILQILTVLLDGDPTDDSVEVAIQLLTTVGYALLEVSPAGVRAVVDRLRALLHEGLLNQRVEYKLEQLLVLRKTGFRDGPPPLPEDLDLVERDDQITFEIGLDDDGIDKEDALDVFHVDPEYKETEDEWNKIKTEVLGLNDDDDDGENETDDEEEDGGSDDNMQHPTDANNNNNNTETALVPAAGATTTTVVVRDLSEADLVHLRRTIYLTIMSSATFEECTHKLTKIDIPQGREEELINMIIECCSQERTFLRYYGLVAARFCLLNERWRDAFIDAFTNQYTTIHRLETNKLRNVAKLFAHLLHTDSLPWTVLSVIHLNEDETTSSSRIFLKILVQEIAEALGMSNLKTRFETKDPILAESFQYLFPKDPSNVRNTRYAINFFTSIGLGPLTDGLREYLKNAPKRIMEEAQQQQAATAAVVKKKRDDESDASSVLSSSSSSTNSDDSYSSSTSRSRNRDRRRRTNRRSRRRSRSVSSSSSSDSRSSYSSSSGGSRTSTSSRSLSLPQRRRRRRRRPLQQQRRSYSSSDSSSRNSRSHTNDHPLDKGKISNNYNRRGRSRSNERRPITSSS